MRAALEQSIRDRPDGRHRHEAGDLVLCTNCAKPLFVLEQAIDLGMKAGRMVGAFAPVTLADLAALAAAAYVDAGITAWARGLDDKAARLHCDTIQRPKAGDPMQCPFCDGPFVQVLTAEKTDTLDKAYTLELVTVPLMGRAPAVRGRIIGTDAGWVHGA